jgi:hypothetical protein
MNSDLPDSTTGTSGFIKIEQSQDNKSSASKWIEVQTPDVK